MLNVILVEDEYIVRRGMQVTIEWERHGFRLVGAVGNGQEALDLMEREPVDIVITDVRMPVIDGIELCRQIRSRGIKCEIIILSSYDNFEYAKQAMIYGARDYLHKPALTPESMIDTLTRVAGMRTQERQTQSRMHSYDTGYNTLLKNAVRRLISRGERKLYESLLQDERARQERVGMILVACRNPYDAVVNHPTLLQLARRLHEEYQDDDRVVSVLLEDGTIAIFCFGEEAESFCCQLSEKRAQPECIVLWNPPVQLGELPDAFETFWQQMRLRLSQESPDFHCNEIVSQALAIIMEQYCRRLTLADVAGAVHVTPPYLSRLLMREYGKNFIDLLSERRIQKAQELLTTTNLEIERITDQVGYKNSKYFIKAFKRMTGLTPGQYRKEHAR